MRDFESDKLQKAKERAALKKECDFHIAQCNAVISLLKTNPDLAITIRVNGLEFGLCHNANVIKMLKGEITEARACKAGKPNKYE